MIIGRRQQRDRQVFQAIRHRRIGGMQEDNLTRLRLRPMKHVAVAPIAGSSRVLVETSLTGTDQWPKRLQETKPRDRSRGNDSTKGGRDPWQSRQVDGRGDRPNISQPL